MDNEKEEGREIDSGHENGCIKISGWVGEWTCVKWEAGVFCPTPPPLTGPALGLTLGPAPSVSGEPPAELAGPWPGPWAF